MERNEQIRLLKLLMSQLDSDTNVDAGGIRKNPTWVYTCEEHAAKEWDRLFRNHPQVVGLSGDLPESGDFFTLNDFGVPILATRDASGRFRAFANVCRHRGTLVEDEACGHKKRFSCPFHSWTYSNAGELVGIPKAQHFGTIDRKDYGLHEFPAEEKYGFLWIHPVREASLDVDALLGGLAPEFASWRFDELIRRGHDTFDMPLNWKLAVDTFGETYHFNSIHRNSLALNFYGNAQGYDKFERNHRMTLCMQSIDQLRDRPEAEWSITDGAFPVYYLFPNIQVNVGATGIVLVRIYPDPQNPARSISRVSFYARPEAINTEAPGVAAGERQRFFAHVIRDEDYVAAASSQKGADSGVQETVTFGRNEPALHHYHNTYREALGMEPLPLLEA